MARPGEFDLIAQYFAPLATAPGALRLLDDAAVFALPPGREVVVTTDAVVAGVHFLSDDPAETVARKALRVNLSDLAAMGAEPVGYTVALALTEAVDEDWVAGFAAALKGDQETYGLSLLGGDTVGTPGPLTVSITALGSVPAGAALRRSGARPGDMIFVSGTIGDAALGLDSVRGAIDVEDLSAREFLEDRYRHPRPRTALGPRLVGTATACIDISDGLIGDLDHMCTASGCGARLEALAVPVSSAAASLSGDPLARRLTGGDDYELLFAVPPDRQDEVRRLAAEAGIAVAAVGVFQEGTRTVAVDGDGAEIVLSARSWRHF